MRPLNTDWMHLLPPKYSARKPLKRPLPLLDTPGTELQRILVARSPSNLLALTHENVAALSRPETRQTQT
eukprot:11163941-Lingulodinium_polyedra.AAC.1